MKEINDKIHGILVEDYRMHVRQIGEPVAISTKWMHNILHENLYMKKLSVRWAPIVNCRTKMH